MPCACTNLHRKMRVLVQRMINTDLLVTFGFLKYHKIISRKEVHKGAKAQKINFAPLLPCFFLCVKPN